MTMAIIGAGLSGLACAETLVANGAAVTLFEKSRGFGGRAASRRRDGLCFDHGLPAFDAIAQESVEAFADAVAWSAGGTVAVPRMNALPRALGERHHAHMETRIATIRHDGKAFSLIDTDDASHGPFTHVVVAVPAPQAADLLSDHGSAFAPVSDARYAPGWTLMLGGVAEDGPDRAQYPDDTGPVATIISEDSKPGRDALGCWTVHARTSWVREHLEDDAANVAKTLAAEFTLLTGLSTHDAIYASAHRWRFCQPELSIDAPFLLDGQLGACGDWCGANRSGGDARAAWRSGQALAHALL